MTKHMHITTKTVGLVLAIVVSSSACGTTQKPQPEQPAVKQQEKTYTGAKIDLDLRAVDIQNALSLFAEVGKVKFVTTDAVKGPITFHAHGEPWDQALDELLQANKLKSTRDGDTIRIEPL